MKVNVIIRDAVREVMSCSCSQTGRYATKKFCELLDNAVTREKVFLGGDFNDYVGRRFGIGKLNDGEAKLMD